MRPSYISRIHRETGDSMYDSIGGVEMKNMKLKERIEELKYALMPLPLLSSPLKIAKHTTPTTQLKGSSILLT
jgi:hypothetical protein